MRISERENLVPFRKKSRDGFYRDPFPSRVLFIFMNTSNHHIAKPAFHAILEGWLH